MKGRKVRNCGNGGTQIARAARARRTWDSTPSTVVGRRHYTVPLAHTHESFDKKSSGVIALRQANTCCKLKWTRVVSIC